LMIGRCNHPPISFWQQKKSLSSFKNRILYHKRRSLSCLLWHHAK
jgi:hypothetical protein